MLDYTKYRAKVDRILEVIGEAKFQRKLIMNDDSRKDSWYSEQTGKVRQKAAAEIQQLLGEMRVDLAKALKKSEPKPKEIGDFNERNYKSNAVAQEIAELRPEQLVEYFSKLGESDDRVKLQEAYRLIDTKFGYLSGHGVEYNNFRNLASKLFPDEFSQYEATKAAVGTLESGLQTVQGFADQTLDEVINSGTDYSASMIGITIDGTIANAERASQV